MPQINIKTTMFLIMDRPQFCTADDLLISFRSAEKNKPADSNNHMFFRQKRRMFLAQTLLEYRLGWFT
jgi:hypothetical protein